MGLFSTTKLRLERNEEHLRQLSGTLRAFLQNNPSDWRQPIAFSLSGQVAPAIEVARHFLVVWLDWTALLARWRSLYRASSDDDSLLETDADCGGTATALVENAAFLDALGQTEVGSDRAFDFGGEPELPDEASTVPDGGDIEPDFEPDEWLDALLLAHDEAVLAGWLSPHAHSATQRLRSRAEGLQSDLLREYQNLPPAAHHTVAAALAHYRRHKLQFLSQQSSVPFSALDQLLETHKPLVPMFRIDRKDSPAFGIIDNHLNPVLRDLVGLFAEAGYTALVHDLAEESSFIGIAADNPNINVIPGHATTACRPLLVAFSTGNTGPQGFAAVLADVRSHLIDCAPPSPSSGEATKVVAFFCDYWDAAAFDAHFYSDLARFHCRGVEFVFILAGCPRSRTVLSEINVAFK